MFKTTNSIISNVEDLICIIENDFSNFSTILDQIVGHIIKNSQQLLVFVTFINGQLSNAETRNRGLILLHSLLQHCPYDVMIEHALAWINNSLKYCEHERELNDTAFQVLKPLLEVCNKTPELNKAVVSNIIEKVIDVIRVIDNKSANSIPALNCLQTCLNIYPGGCGPRRINIQKYLITYLNNPVPSTSVRIAGKCFNALQQVGSSGNDGVNFYNTWKLTQQCLCITIHNLMDEFFENITEFGDHQDELKGTKPLDLSELPECKTFQGITYRMINTIIFLEEMLLESYPVKKSILPNMIMNVISRGLAITSSTLGVHVTEDLINLSSYLTLIHKHLLHLLQCLIVSLGTNLIPWGKTICKSIVHNLKSVSTEDAFLISTISELRLTAYETLRLWITTVKAASNIEGVINTLLPIIINDTSTIKKEVNLLIQSNVPKNLSKKARKKLIEQSTSNFAAKNEIGLNRNFENFPKYQHQVCTSALQSIQTILHYEGFNMKPLTHKQMQEFIIKSLYNIQRDNISHPYDNGDCQIELYKTLIKLTINHHYNINPPVHYAINLLTNGQSHHNIHISEICSNGLMILNSTIHPYCATLQLPLDIENVKAELKRDLEDNKQKNVDENTEDSDEEMEIDNEPEEKVNGKINENHIEKKEEHMEINSIEDTTKQTNLNNKHAQKAIIETIEIAESNSNDSATEIPTLQIDSSDNEKIMRKKEEISIIKEGKENVEMKIKNMNLTTNSNQVDFTEKNNKDPSLEDEEAILSTFVDIVN